VNVRLAPVAASEHSVRIEASLAISTLAGFTETGAPAYEEKVEKRTLWIPAGRSALIPVLIATQKERDAFGVRELLLRFRAGESSADGRADYGEIAVTADMPRASILLDGGFVGRTSSEGPVVLGAVRTGDREVIVRDPSGREARSVVRVKKDRKVVASFALLPNSTGIENTPRRPLGSNAQATRNSGARRTGRSSCASREANLRWEQGE
jgi:hypothetical protein